MPRPPLDAESIRRLGQLARLDIPDERASVLAVELTRVVEYIEQLAKIEGFDPVVPAPLSRRLDVPVRAPQTGLLSPPGDAARPFVRVPSVAWVESGE